MTTTPASCASSHVAPGTSFEGGLAVPKPASAVAADVGFGAVGTVYDSWVGSLSVSSDGGLKLPGIDNHAECTAAALDEEVSRSATCGPGGTAMVDCKGTFDSNSGICHIECTGGCEKSISVVPSCALSQ